MICLFGDVSVHKGNEPVLAFYDGKIAVMVDANALLASGREPVQFATSQDAAAVALLLRGQHRIIDLDETRDGQGKLTRLTRKALSADVLPPAKP